jgi:DNA polymerase (family 10)
LSDKQSVLFPTTSNTSATLNVLQGLVRAEVEPLASELLEVLKPFCSRAEVTGSFRRGKPVVNDLDIVLEPNLWSGFGSPDPWLLAIKAVRGRFCATTEKQGDKLATLHLPFDGQRVRGYVQVDFYRADSSTWGVLLLVRTGSKEHNVKLCNLAISKELRLQYSLGLTDKDGRVVAGRTEKEVFAALGLGYVEPKDREVEQK